MKAISLWQPWATLLVLGVKRLETRSWSTNVRGPVAIHAARRRPGVRADFPELYELLARAGLGPEDLPLGALLGHANLRQVYRTDDLTDEAIEALGANPIDERLAGNFDPGRYAWAFAAPKRALSPVPWRGSQGFFDVPATAVQRSLLPRGSPEG